MFQQSQKVSQKFHSTAPPFSLRTLSIPFRSEEHKNGHKLSSSRLSSFLDAEYDQEGLKGARATSHRRLPDLPDPLLNGTDNSIGRIGSVRSSQDTSSELYAQVEIGIANNSCKPIKITSKKIEKIHFAKCLVIPSEYKCQ